MSQELLINVGIGEVRIARTEDGRLAELAIERAANGSLVGNIYLGRVVRVVANIGAAFVDIGVGRDAFLGAREAQRLHPRADPEGDDREPPINELVSEGEAVLVQVAADAVADKGAALTGAITLPGQLLVHAPTQSGVVVSRRLADEAERDRLKALVEAARQETDAHAGRFIVRTAAAGAGAAAIAADIERLSAAWRDLAAARAEARPPACLFSEHDPLIRALRDLRTTDRIRIDSGPAFIRARDYCQRHRPDLAPRLEYFRGAGALFDHGDIDADIALALEREVRLPSGGAITIDETEALTAIDVDSGALTDAASPRETALRVNLEAAGAIARQLRVRGIGGLIVVDFLDIEAPDRLRLASALQEAFAPDAARPRAGPIPARGVVEITRARVRPSLWMQVTEPCPGCGASGRRPTMETLVGDLLRRAERATNSGRAGGVLHVRAAPVVVRALETAGEAVELLARRIGRPVEIEAMASFERTHFEFEVG